MAAYDLIFVCIFYGSDDQRRKNALRLYAFDQRVHLVIKLLTVDAETLLGKAKTPDAKIAAKKVYEALRYSDPMSSEALGEIEAELAEKFRALEAAVTADQGVTEAAESLLETLAERNRKCKAMK